MLDSLEHFMLCTDAKMLCLQELQLLYDTPVAFCQEVQACRPLCWQFEQQNPCQPGKNGYCCILQALPASIYGL